MILQKTCKHIISLSDLSNDEIKEIVNRAVLFSNGVINPDAILKDKVIGIYFRKTSTRTRTSFSSAALRMGAQIISYGPNDLQENTGERIDDTTRVLSRMLDGFVARTAGSTTEMRSFASQDRMAVINAMSEEEHPTQALADLTTMMKQFGTLNGLRVLYIGEGNNTAAALALALSRFSNLKMYFFTPPKYGLTARIKQQSLHYANQYGAEVLEFHDMKHLPDEMDIVYTTRWQTTGTSKPDKNWRDIFQPFAVTEQLMEKYQNAIFMHDLPAHRGEEVEATVLDGPSSVAFDQAENKLHSAKAVLEWCLNS